MGFYKAVLKGGDYPCSLQAKRIVAGIRKHNCRIFYGSSVFSGMLLKDRYVLTPTVGRRVYAEFNDDSQSELFNIFTKGELSIMRAPLGEDIDSIPPVSYSHSDQFLFAYKSERLLVFQRVRGKFSRFDMETSQMQVWAGLPLFTRNCHLTGIVLGKKGSQFYCTSPHSVIKHLIRSEKVHY